MKACAFCDIEATKMTPQEAFAMGYLLSKSMDQDETMGDAVICNNHRTAALLSTLSVTAKMHEAEVTDVRATLEETK